MSSLGVCPVGGMMSMEHGVPSNKLLLVYWIVLRQGGQGFGRVPVVQDGYDGSDDGGCGFQVVKFRL